MVHNTGVGGNRMGGMTRPEAAPQSEMAVGQSKFAGRDITRWSALTTAVKMFGLEATMQEFSKKY